jgi:hypothetical protein
MRRALSASAIGERCNDMIAAAAFVTGKALQLELTPAELLPDRAGEDQRRLNPADWKGHVGQGEESTPASQACSGAI